MSTLSALYRNLIWLAPVVMGISALGLGFSIRGVVRLVRESTVLSLPLVEQQNLEFREAGPMSLWVEGPQFSTRFRGLHYELSTDTGVPVPGRPVLFRSSTSSFKSARLEIRSYDIPHPGRFVLRVQGLGPAQERDASHRLVFTRPHTGQIVGWVLGIVFSGIVLIGSLIFFLFRVVVKDPWS